MNNDKISAMVTRLRSFVDRHGHNDMAVTTLDTDDARAILAHIDAQAAGIAEERARIVAWLRDGNAWLNVGECCGSKDSDGVCLAPACKWGEELKALHKAADAIEAGEHLK